MDLQLVTPTPAKPATPAITDDEAAALARTTVNLFHAWQITDAEACTLLGGMAKRTWARWKNVPAIIGEGWVGYTPLHGDFEESEVGRALAEHGIDTAQAMIYR